MPVNKKQQINHAAVLSEISEQLGSINKSYWPKFQEKTQNMLNDDSLGFGKLVKEIAAIGERAGGKNPLDAFSKIIEEFRSQHIGDESFKTLKELNEKLETFARKKDFILAELAPEDHQKFLELTVAQEQVAKLYQELSKLKHDTDTDYAMNNAAIQQYLDYRLAAYAYNYNITNPDSTPIFEAMDMAKFLKLSEKKQREELIELQSTIQNTKPMITLFQDQIDNYQDKKFAGKSESKASASGARQGFFNSPDVTKMVRNREDNSSPPKKKQKNRDGSDSSQSVRSRVSKS